VLVLIIWESEFVGRKPPADINVMARLKLLNNLTLLIENKIKINNVNAE
jgi:hypothetical protein